MAHTRKTLLLDENWDVQLTKSGRIAVAEGDYATAQNVANECRLFTEDAYFDQERGIPYFLLALGQKVPGSALRARIRSAALLVEDVAAVTDVTLDTLNTDTRELTGEVRFTSREGTSVSVEL